MLLADRDQRLREQIARGQELQAILTENKRFYAYEVQPPLPGSDYTPRFNVEFSGDPEAPVTVQGGNLQLLTLERLKTLTEIVEHVEQWKKGTIEELAPSGVWADVRPRSNEQQGYMLEDAVTSVLTAADGPPGPSRRAAVRAELQRLNVGRPPFGLVVGGRRPTPDVAARIPFDCVTTIDNDRARLHPLGEYGGRYADCSSLDVAYALHDLIINAASTGPGSTTEPVCGWCRAPQPKGERSEHLMIPWCGHCYTDGKTPVVVTPR